MDNLITQLWRNSEALASGITPPGIGSDPAHFLTGQAAAKIESDAKVIAALRELLALAWDSRGPDYVEASHPGWCNKVRDLLSDADEQTAGESK